MSTVPNVVGAICLNQAGLDLTTSHPNVLTNLIATTVSPSHEEAMSERDNAQHLGSALDELVRHHPRLRPIVLDAVLTLLRKAVDDGAAFVPSPEKKHEYAVDAISSSTDRSSNTHLVALAKVFKVRSDGWRR